MENHSFSWVFIHYFDWAMFNSYVAVYQRVSGWQHCHRHIVKNPYKKNPGCIWISLGKKLTPKIHVFIIFQSTWPKLEGPSPFHPTSHSIPRSWSVNIQPFSVVFESPCFYPRSGPKAISDNMHSLKLYYSEWCFIHVSPKILTFRRGCFSRCFST